MYAIFSNISFSTHILTRRMTCPSPWKCTPVNFSTHILTRRMTDGKREQESSSHFFNSHPHKEDDIFIITVFTLTSFSTHILTRRMTTPIPQVLVSHVFNSHPHKEDDQTIHRQCPQYYLFNSHPHKEDDATSGSLRLWEVYFQLTSSQGG